MYTPHFFSKIQMLLGPNLAHLLSAQDQGAPIIDMSKKSCDWKCKSQQQLKNVTVPSPHLSHLPILLKWDTGPRIPMAWLRFWFWLGRVICDVKEEQNCKEQTHDHNWTVKRPEDCIINVLKT